MENQHTNTLPPELADTAAALEEALGIKPELHGNAIHTYQPNLGIRLTGDVPMAARTIHRLHGLNQKIHEDAAARGEIISAPQIFYLENDNTIRFNRSPIQVQYQVSGNRNVSIAEILAPYKEDFAKIISDAPAEARQQAAEEQVKLDIANGYARQLSETLGVDANGTSEDLIFNMREYFATFKVDRNSLLDVYSAFNEALRKSGLSNYTYLKMNLDDATLSIPAQDIQDYDLQRGKGAFIANIATVKDNIIGAFHNAKTASQEFAGLPTLELDTQFELHFAQNEGQKNISIQFGDFSALPPEVVADAIQKATEIRKLLTDNKDRTGTDDPAKIKQFAPAANIDGNATDLTDHELAAWILAKSLNAPEAGHNMITQGFDYKLSGEELIGEKQDPRLVFEAARQIYGDALKEKIEGVSSTTSEEGNNPYLNAIRNSPDTAFLRKL